MSDLAGAVGYHPRKVGHSSKEVHKEAQHCQGKREEGSVEDKERVSYKKISTVLKEISGAIVDTKKCNSLVCSSWPQKFSSRPLQSFEGKNGQLLVSLSFRNIKSQLESESC